MSTGLQKLFQFFFVPNLIFWLFWWEIIYLLRKLLHIYVEIIRTRDVFVRIRTIGFIVNSEYTLGTMLDCKTLAVYMR